MNPLQHLRRNLVAYLALFLALTAGAYAAGLKKNSVGSKQIKSGAVKTDEIADGAVTGAKIASGTLGRVANAAQADSATTATRADTADNATNAHNATNAQNATNATNAQHAETAGDANTVGGQSVKTFSTSQDVGAGETQVTQVGGLRLSLDCNGGGDNEIRATSAVNDANIKSVATYATADTDRVVVNDQDFDTADTALIVPHAVDASNLVGQIVYRTTAGHVTTVQFAVDSPAGQCSVWGSAIGS